MNNAKVERALDSSALAFSYEQDGVRVHLEGMDSLPPRVAKNLEQGGLQFHSVQNHSAGVDVVFKERGMGNFL